MKPEALIRLGQCEAPPFADLFRRLYKFVRLSTVEFFADTPGMPIPVLTLEALPGNKRLAMYVPQDTTTLKHVIKLDPYKAHTAHDLCEPLVHEMVHMWEAHCGYPQAENYHHDRFHERMVEMGIATKGRHGRHVGYEGEVWEDWMIECGHLRLMDFVLPGTDAQPRKRLVKYTCTTCGFSFHVRRRGMVVMCNGSALGGEPLHDTAAMVAS